MGADGAGATVVSLPHAFPRVLFPLPVAAMGTA